MKTKILIFICILFPLFISAQINPNDFKWGGTRNYRNDFDVKFLKDQYNTFYYLMDNYIKIKSNFKNQKPTSVEFENGEVKKISDSIYCIIPKKLGRFNLIINGEAASYKVIELPVEKIELKLSASTSPFSDCITMEELLKSNEVTATYCYNKFKFRYYSFVYEMDNPFYIAGESLIDTIPQSFKKTLKENLKENGIIDLREIKIYMYDTIETLKPLQIKVVDNYQNEFIRRSLKISPQTNDLNIIKNDLRIKLDGDSIQEVLKVMDDIANELNGLLETIKIRIVDRQPSLLVKIDTISYKMYKIPKIDSTLLTKGYRVITGGYLKEINNEFFPFSRKFILYFENKSNARALLRNTILDLLVNFAHNNISGSYFNKEAWASDLSDFDKQMLKTLYSPGGEEKVMSILNKENTNKQKSPVYILLLVLTISLMFVFSEIYNYYNIGSFIAKVRMKFLKRIIEAILVAQIPVIAYLILEFINNGINALFHEFLFLESMLIPFSVLSGVFLLFLDKLLEKIKILWINTILNLILSFFCIALAYQLMYFFITPEFIKLSVIGWEILLVPFLITLYRLYARFQTNRISGLLQEKELELSKQKELKFKSDLNALQARINPHFLYNALNSLASLAHIDSGRTEKMALSLSKLFRYNINKKEEHYAPLQEEIEMASIYLEIEKNRFEDKLNYSIELQEQLKEFIIPKFILQPLAENAVKHGISKITGKGMIRINIFEEVGKVIIEIYDNGPAFPGGLISGYGLQNTYEKLKLLYKNPFDISFINSPEKKLVITLTK